MLITEIIEYTKNRSKVFIDQQFAFVLYKGELLKYYIEVGKEIAEYDYDTIVHELLPKRAKLRAMNLLKSKDYTEKKIRDKLKEGMYSEQIINETIEYLKQYRYIDDQRYTENYISYHQKSKSRNNIEAELLRRGIEKNCFKIEWEKYKEENEMVDEISIITELLKKKNYQPDTSDMKEKQRLYGFLLRRGFSSELISRALR